MSGKARLQYRAIVIEELDHRDIALRIAEHDLVRRVEDVALLSLIVVRAFSASASFCRLSSASSAS